MAIGYTKLKKQLEELKYTDPTVTVIEDEKGNKISQSIKPTISTKQTTFTSKLSPTFSSTKVSTKKDDNDKWFKSGAFGDDKGNIFTDTIDTILGTTGDIVVGATKGIFNLAEGIVDAGRYGVAGVADLLGADNYAEDVKERAKQNTTNILFGGIEKAVDKSSVLGNKADAIPQGLGYVAGLIGTGGLAGAAGLGSAGVTAVTTGTTFSSAFGSGMSQAYESGATDEEATKYGLIAGIAEAGTELMFGGLGKAVGATGLSKGFMALDDKLATKVSSVFKSTLAKNLAEYTVKAGGEGIEEVASGLLQAIGQKVTYMSEEDLGKLIEDQNLLESFITGAVVSGIAQTPSLIKTTKADRDYVSGYTQNEQSIIDKEVENRIKELETDNKKLTNKEIAKIEEQVKNDLQKGYISTDTIESTFGGEEYNTYKSALDNKIAIENEIKELENKPYAELTVKENERLQAIREELKRIDTNTLKNNLEISMASKIANDGYLQQSYAEKANRSVKFEADLSKYDTKQQETIQKAIDSGILNNTNKTHEFVDMIAKISADKGVSFDFANNAKLKESGFAIEGKQVNGLVNENGITLNIDSSNALNKVVGHEITHVLEGTELYTELQQAVKEYATTKGVYDTKLAELTEIYKGVDNANIENELTSELVGEYLFTDADFVNNLSTTKPNVFKKIYDEIKYLLKVATAGSKEARQLEKVKKAFEEAYRNSTSNVSQNTKYSIKQTSDGSKYVNIDTDQHIFEGKTVAEQNKIAKEYILNTFRENGLIADGNEIKVNNKTATKYTNPRENISDSKKRVKNRISTELDNLLNVSTLIKTEADQKNHAFAKDGWEYYLTTFKVDDSYFTGVANVGVNGDTRTLYDINQIKKTTHNDKVENTTAISVESPFTGNTISQNTDNVKFSLTDNQGRTTSKDLTKRIYEIKNQREELRQQLLELRQERKSITESIPNYSMFKQYDELNDVNKRMDNNKNLSKELYAELQELETKIEEVKEQEKNERIAKEEAEATTHKLAQNKIIQETNPMLDDYHTGIRSVGDIKTWQEAMTEAEEINEGYSWGDFSKEDAQKALKRGTIRVYSSYAIKNGTFVSTSYQQALDYAGGERSKVHSREVALDSVAWISVDEGQYAKVYKTNYSLSNPNEDIAPSRNDIYGSDIKLEETISPLQEEIGKVVDEVQRMREQIDKMLSPIKEVEPEHKPTTYDDLEAIEKQYEENTDYDESNIITKNSDNFFLPNEINMVESEKEVKDFIRNTLGLNVRQTSDVYKSITAIEDFDIDDVKNAIEEYSQFITDETDTNLQDLKKAIRTTKLDISYLKATDSTFKDYVKNAFGSMRLANSGQAVDSFYNEMSSMYPDLLPSNIDNEADQFQRLLEVSKMDHITKYTEAIPEETMNKYANEIYNTIKNYQDTLAIQNSNKDFFNAVKKGDIVEPVENVDYYEENLKETVENASIHGKEVKISPTMPISMETIESNQSTIKNEPSRVEQQIAQILDEKPTKKFDNKRVKAIAVANIVDKGYYISKLARQTDNRQLDALWDNTLLSNAQAQEVIGEGRFKLNEDTKTYDKVGEGVYEIFEGVENTNKVKDFNEYMYHKLNIERMSLESNAQAQMKALKETTLKDYTNEEINKMARMQIRADADQEIIDRVNAAKEYKNLSKVKNKPVFGFDIDADTSIDIVNKLEGDNPEFSDYAKKVYEYESGTYSDLSLLVESGILSVEEANYYRNKYESYVPIIRDMEATMLEGQMFGKRVSVGNAVKSATGGSQNIIPLKDAMAIKTMLVQRSANMNKLGLELMHTLNPVTETETVTAENIIEDISNNKDIVQAGANGKAPTMTVYEHGVKHTFEIPVEIYEALKANYDGISKFTFKPANAFSSFKRGVLTQYNPFFMVTNMIKDAQDVLINSQHPASTYKAIPEAIAQLTSKGYWYKEMQAQGLFQDTYYDNQGGFDTTKKGLSKITEFYPLRKISEINDFIERVPRMAEYIASRKAGASVEVASLDASRVTTNFKAGGDWTKFLNRNGATFLNASVQGALQQVRNVQEAHQKGLKGYMALATKFTIAALPAVLLNNLLWDDDEEYEELSDYIKDNYYIIGKYSNIENKGLVKVFEKMGLVHETTDGVFIRIPKGRMTAVIQKSIKEMQNLITGDDEVDLGSYLELVANNIAPSNPIENNILSPFLNTKLFSKDDPGKTWYGTDLVPTRLQDKPAAEQYDETTDELSKWLGEKLNLSPIKINNLIDQNTGVIGDLLLPYMTAEAKTKTSNPFLAAIEDKFTADVVFDNKYSTDFYSTKEELAKASNSYEATDEDILKTKYMNSKQAQMNNIYAEIREVQNSSLDKETKYAQVRELRKELNDIAETSLNSYEDINVGSNYAKVGDIEFKKNTSGEWEKITAKQLEKQNEVTNTLGISADDYWNNKDEYDYAYENPSKYATAIAIADYETYKTYTDALNDITADKDSEGKSISGSRKQKVFDYVNSLDLDFEQKVMLAKLEYPSYDEYNYEIVDYLNNRNDINYDEMVSILTELGFKVDANGNVSWD